ncbi:MAG TPA: HD domain-containing phosphohydrolase [Terriglobales bacterium]|nr:HD domain-containing phosphohydrolase [Terriglobales bacterium]
MTVKKNNFRRLLGTFETLADLGPELTAERDFPETARVMLTLLLEALGAREGALFTYSDKPALLASVAWHGFALFPEAAVIPLLPRHVHALQTARTPQALTPKSCDNFLSSNGNVAPELFKCIAPLRVGSKLVGMLALGRRDADAVYEGDEFDALGLMANYIALAVHNHSLSQSLQHRIAENLRLLASLHSFYDQTLEAFASAIDVKDVHTHGHSLRVGRYAAGIATSLGMDETEVSGLRAAGYLHDIGKVTVDKYIFAKPTALGPEEFREMADHTIIGHKIVSGVEFPWPKIADVVRWHHERSDGSGYPDRLRNDDVVVPVRITGVADTFDAMTSPRPYRQPLSVGEAISEIVRLSPQKFDPNIVQGLLVQVRRDATGRNRPTFLDERLECNIAPTDVDQVAAALNYRINKGRVYSA